MSGPSLVTRVRDAIFANIGLKLFSLLLAVGFYAYVRGAGNTAQRQVMVDVVTLLPPESADMMLVSEMPDRVQVLMSGRSAGLASITRESVSAIQVDLRDPSRRLVTFDPRSVEVPAGVVVDQIIPSTVELRWERRIERRLPIVARVFGAPPNGLELRGIARVIPEEASVVGAESEVSRLRQLATEPIELSTYGEGTFTKPIALEDVGAHVLVREAENIAIEFAIAPRLEERLLRRLDVVVVGGTISGAPRPSRVDVRVRGLPDLVNNVDPDHVLPTVEIAETDAAGEPAFHRLSVRGLPTGVEVISTSPQEVLITRR